MEDAMDGRPLISRWERNLAFVVFLATFFFGAWWAANGLIQAAFRVIDPSRYPVTLLADSPVEHGSGIISAVADTVTVRSDELSSGAVWMLASADFLQALTIAGVLIGSGMVVERLLRGKPFHRVVRPAILLAACSLAFGSLLTQGVRGLGQMMAAFDLNDQLDGILVPGFMFDIVPIMAAFGLLAFTYVIGAGMRLQRDTKGLV
jgi:hypothetical protein